ncbi:Uncharacterised protein [uncultured archaeon]|nr:Uncharacterised protein [uncultured archaeon]
MGQKEVENENCCGVFEMRDFERFFSEVLNLKWHAKIFILKNNANPILGIIGSSNITRPAFSDNVPFNYEADIVLWSNGNVIIDSMMRRIAEIIRDDTNYSHEVITTDYNPERNNGLSIEDRLNRLNNEIENLNLRDLPE